MALKDGWAYTSIALGENVFPFDSREGTVTFDPECSRALDVAKPHGKDAPKITDKGKEAPKVKLDLVWSYRIEEATKAFLLAVSPHGPNGGIPLDITHPDAEIFGIDSMIVERMSGLKREPGKAQITLTGTGWKKTEPAQAGGAKVPGAAKPAATVPEANDHITFETSDGNTIDMGEGPLDVETSDGNTYGFGGDDPPAVGE